MCHWKRQVLEDAGYSYLLGIEMTVEYKEIVKQTISKLQSGGHAEPQVIQSSAYLFISLDLVNSTEFKSKCEGWPALLESFYSNADHEVKKIPDIQSWKFVGDEVLFYKKLRSIQDLEDALAKALTAVKTVSAQVRNAQLSDERARNAPHLSVKGTAWIGKAATVPAGSNRNEIGAEHRNLVVPTRGPRDQPLIDFLGPDIDTGFRVSKFARSNVLAVSAELARVLLKKGSGRVIEMLRIVGYRQLKGVWGNRHYPIVWLSDTWRSPNELFQYDEKFESELVAEAIVCATVNLSCDALDRPFTEVGHEQFNQDLLAIIDNDASNGASDALAELYATDVLQLEVHAVAVCFRDDGKVLVGKRPVDKRVMPGKWEFGCAQLMPHKDFFDAMLSHYKSDFGASLEFPCRDPIGHYFVEESRIPGVIFIARVANPDGLQEADWGKKHSEISWVDPACPGIDSADSVPEFLATLEKASSAWRKCRATSS